MHDPYVTAMDEDNAFYDGNQHHRAVTLRRESHFPVLQPQYREAAAAMPTRDRYRDMQPRVPDDIEDDESFHQEETMRYNAFGM